MPVVTASSANSGAGQVRTMFVFYSALIFGGIVFFVSVGLTQ